MKVIIVLQIKKNVRHILKKYLIVKYIHSKYRMNVLNVLMDIIDKI